ncbi:MAG: NAD(P)/FAD-dependent oxidoreductase [Gammaproteobacteria bacterium]|nr:MAG: NAD(P)/FAD-dependent oxidoreductase [Gammaproteobacteria bacterium]
MSIYWQKCTLEKYKMALAAVDTSQDFSEATSSVPVLDHDIVIIGCGFSGLGTGIKLLKKGFGDFIILEKADGVGGTWRDNTYPGLAVDVPTLSYSFGFEQNPHWSNLYAPGSELKAYAEHCAKKYGITAHLRYNCDVTETAYDEENNVWVTSTADGRTFTSRYVVSATGYLTLPKLPDIEGIDDFRGKKMHTGRWDHSHDLTGERVGFIGTGATAIQVIPEIVPKLKSLSVYQRTPIWLLPKKDMPIPNWLQAGFKHVPGLQRSARTMMQIFTDTIMINGLVFNKQLSWMIKWLEKFSIKHIRSQVNDPEIQNKLIPEYDFGCKRPSFTNKFYPVFNEEHVELVTDSIERVTEKGIVTSDGKEREIDTLIYGTGFEVFQKGSVPTFGVKGLSGLDISDYWEANRYQAFEGATVPQFPNFFMIMGPYSVCSASYFGMIETQTRHLTRCLKAAEKRNANYIEVKQSANDKNFKKIQKRAKYTIFQSGNCGGSNSYYIDRHGDSPFIRPSTSIEHWLTSCFFRMSNYNFKAK